MKKLFAILMIAIHLFNLAGYHFLFNYYILRADKGMAQRLDNNQYTDAELVEIKVKLNMPYMTVSGDYERFDGEFTLDGEFYKFVKRKISHDTLYMLCLPDHDKELIYKEKTAYAAMSGESPAGKSGKEDNARQVKKSSLGGEYVCQLKQPDLFVFRTVVMENVSIAPSRLAETFLATIGQPPDTMA